MPRLPCVCASSSFSIRAASAFYEPRARARARVRVHMPKWPCLWAVGAGSQDGHFGYRRRGACLGCLALCLLLLLDSSGLGLLRTTRACARARACICPSGRAYGPWAPGAKTDILVIEGGGLASAALRCCLLLLLDSSGLGLLRTTRACAHACVCICPSGRAYGPWAPGAKTDILVIEGGGLASAALRCASSSFLIRAASAFYEPRAHARARARAYAQVAVLMGRGRREPRRTFWL